MRWSADCRTLCAVALSILGAAEGSSARAQAPIHLELPAQSLADSLRALGKQANVNLLFEPALVAGLRAPAINAQLTAREALGRLLDGTHIEYWFLNDHTVVLRASGAAAVDPAQTTLTPRWPPKDGTNSKVAPDIASPLDEAARRAGRWCHRGGEPPHCSRQPADARGSR